MTVPLCRSMNFFSWKHLMCTQHSRCYQWGLLLMSSKSDCLFQLKHLVSLTHFASQIEHPIKWSERCLRKGERKLYAFLFQTSSTAKRILLHSQIVALRKTFGATNLSVIYKKKCVHCFKALLHWNPLSLSYMTMSRRISCRQRS